MWGGGGGGAWSKQITRKKRGNKEEMINLDCHIPGTKTGSGVTVGRQEMCTQEIPSYIPVILHVYT